MRVLWWLLRVVLAGFAVAAATTAVRLATGAAAASSAINGPRGAAVLQYHKHASRDGLYVEPALTQAAARRFRRDLTFDAPLSGPTYAQPLFWAATGPTDRDLLVVATEQNQVYAFDAASSATVWRRSIAPPVSQARLPCGNIDPLGITGTPVIDPASRTVFFDAMTTPDGGATKKHLIVALSIDDGSTRPGWPVDVSAAVRAGATPFDSAFQNQRGALALMEGTVYVPYGGHFGDCGTYHGWVVGVPIHQPASPRAWATRAAGGGIWAPGGIASDGTALYVATGNTFRASSWQDGEAIIRLGPMLAFSGQAQDYFAPVSWRSLDAGDVDLGGSGPVLIRVPGASPTELVVAMGKAGEVYLIDRGSLGGVGEAVAHRRVARDPIINAAAAFTTPRATYLAFKGHGIGCPEGQSGDLTSIRIEPASPPRVAVAWCADQKGRGSPIVTTTDGESEAIVWGVGAEGDGRLHGFDGATGRVVFDGGGPGDVMPRVRRYQTPIVAKGRIFVAGDDRLYAFTSQ